VTEFAAEDPTVQAMPKKSQHQSSAEANAAPGSTASVDRALIILAAFTKERPQQGLAELS
jgi:hypothetical protein